MSEMPALLERYELKFVIPEHMVDHISDFASVYCHPDRHSEQSPDGYYCVYSLYFDSPDFLFLRNRLEKVANRFNMRVRTYDKESGTPCFLEVKQKRDGIIICEQHERHMGTMGLRPGRQDGGGTVRPTK